MSAPRLTLHPAERRDDARLTRAAAWRELSEPTRRTMRQRCAHPSMVVSATKPCKPHGSDVPFQMVTLARASGATMADALAYWTRGTTWTMALYRDALRSVREMLTAAQEAEAAYQTALTAALADGEFTPSEQRACAERKVYAVTIGTELAAALAAAAERDERSGPGTPPRPAA